MGKENTFAGIGNVFYFCRTKDIGTEKEKWHEAKLERTDSIKAREATEVPELNVEEPKWNTSFSFTETVEPDDQFRKFARDMKKHQSAFRRYVYKKMNQSEKKALRQCHQHMNQWMFKKK